MELAVFDGVRLSPVNLSLPTDQNGAISVSVQVPGAFSGLDGYDLPPASGRYLSSIDIWADVGEVGDRAYGFQLVDQDGVIPVPARAAFPSYPVIMNFYDDQVVETDTLKAGLQLKPGSVTSLKPPSTILNFIPSGLYINGSIQSATASSGKMFRFNLVWGKYVAPPVQQAVIS